MAYVGTRRRETRTPSAEGRKKDEIRSPKSERARLQLRFVIEGEAEEAVAAGQLELMGDVLAVRLDGADTACQQFCDFFAGAVFGDQFENLPFRGGKRGQAELLLLQGLAVGVSAQQCPRQGWTDVTIANGHLMNGLEQIRDGGLFKQVAFDAQVQGLVQQGLLGIHSEDDQRDGQALARQEL